MASSPSHGLLQMLQLRTDRTVEQARAHFHDEATEHRRVDGQVDGHVAAHHLTQRILERRPLRVAERLRRGHLGRHLAPTLRQDARSEEHTSELQSLLRISYAVFFLKKTTNYDVTHEH